VLIRVPLAASVVAACSLTLAACGGGASSSSTVSTGAAAKGRTLTIYSSQPLQGATRAQSEDVIRGERLALGESGGRVGPYTIRYVALDDATASAGQWDPGVVSSNARKAAQDPTTIAYLGEFNSGASAIALPILNQVPILEVSPSNTYVGLTRAEGADKGEPDKYYPSGKRTYGRVVPADHIQAAAQVKFMTEQGCKKLYILNDKETYGSGIARSVAAGAKAAGMTVLADDGIDEKAQNYRAVAAQIRAKGADCFFFGGNTYGGAIQLWKDVYAAIPSIKLFGPDGVAESSFYAKVGAPGRSTFITVSTLPPRYYPPAAARFFSDFEQKFGKKPETYAIYGYEAMSLVLDAIRRAGAKGADRQAVIDTFLATKDRRSVLGTYSIDKDGDTTLSTYGGYRIRGNELVFDHVIRAGSS
jgi:branched-chain amino acid transport system substrate-binding protein